jgi:hypothetical protein
MHPVTMYQAATEKARKDTIAKFGPEKWPVAPDTEEHAFWLEEVDREMKKYLVM